MADRPNFFDLLELDPGETRQEVIEKRIQEKKTVWARDSTMGSPKKRQEAKRNMDLLPELRDVLADPRLWRQEAEDALRRHGEARTAREKELQEWIDLLKGSEACGDEQLEKICRQFEGTFTAKEIREKLEAAGIRIGSNDKDPKPRQRTDSVTAGNIRRNLDLLKLASLYDFLGRPSDSSATTLRARAEEILKENQRLGRTDAEATARNDLAGIAKTIFQSEEDKKKYDNHRLLEAMEAIENQIQAAGSDGILSAQDLETLIRFATQRGASPDEAREILEERAKKEGWKVERASPGPAPAPRETSPAGGSAGAGGTSPGGTGDEGEPPAPGRLIVRPIPGGLRLSWEAVRLPGVRYRVLRKAGSVPWDEGDGELVAHTGETQADDAAVPPAVPWHYAVFSLRNGLASGVPAHSGPHLILGTDGTVPDPKSQTNIGGLPIRRLAAAGLATLVIGGGAAALWWGPLAGILVKPSPQPIVRAGQTPTPVISTGSTQNSTQPPSQASPTPSPSLGPQSAPGPGATTPQPTSTLNPGISVAGPIPPKPSMPSNSFGNNSGGTNSSTSVLGSSAKLPTGISISPRPSAALPANPEIAVVAVGDALLASPLEVELEKALRDEGLDVVSGSPALDSLRRQRGGGPSVSDILTSLRSDGVHAVVIAQVDHLGDRELSFYGRKDVSSTSRVRIQAYMVDGRRSIGSWSEQIEYTTVNASTEGENAAHRAAPGLANSVRSGWQTLRGTP